MEHDGMKWWNLKRVFLFFSTTFRFLQKAARVLRNSNISCRERSTLIYVWESIPFNFSSSHTQSFSLLQMAIFSINFFYYFLHDCFWDFNHDFVLWQRLRSRWKVVELGGRAHSPRKRGERTTLNNTLATALDACWWSKCEAEKIQLTIQVRQPESNPRSSGTAQQQWMGDWRNFQSSHKFHSSPFSHNGASRERRRAKNW